MLGVGRVDVAVQRAEHGRGRWYHGRFAREDARQVDPGEDPRRGRLGVALDTRELSREQELRIVLGREVRGESARGVDVRIPVDAPEPQELGALEARDHPEHPLLLGDLQARLEAHQVPHLPRAILLP